MRFKIVYQENNKVKIKHIDAKDIKHLKTLSAYPQNIISIKEPYNLSNIINFYKKIDKNEIYELFNQLNIMLKSNININESITLLLQNKQKSYIKDILGLIQNSIQTSKPIDITLKKYKQELGETTILFLKLGIENGNIKESINSLVELNLQNKTMKSQFKDKLRYPIILIASLIIAISMIFIYVVPNFQYIFEILGDNLPLSTIILLGIQDIINQYLYLFLLFPFLLYILGIILYKNYKLLFDKIIISKIPIVSKLIQGYLFYRLFLLISIIVSSKYKFQIAIEHSKSIIKNEYLRVKIDKILKDIRNGKPIADAFENQKIFDDLTIKLLYTAQYTNNYETVLKDITTLHKEYFENSMKKFSAVIEPSIVLLIAIIVLWLVLAVMTPMWDLSSAIS